MTFNELSILVNATARCPEDVFPGVTTQPDLGKAIRKLSAVAHPDANPNNVHDANAAFKRLTTWADRARAKMKGGTWGDRVPSPEFNFRSPLGTYDVYGLARREALFDSLEASLNGTPVLMHVARSRKYELLVGNAEAALRVMNGAPVPNMLEVVGLNGRTAYVTDVIPKGFMPLVSVVGRLRGAVPMGNMLAYLSSLLELIDRASRQRWAHTSVNPGTWWVNPDTNESYLTDWHYACRLGDIARHVNSTYSEFCSWEVREEHPVDKGADIASAMKVFLEAVGTQKTPVALDMLIAAHLREGRARPSDAAKCRTEIHRIYASMSKPK